MRRVAFVANSIVFLAVANWLVHGQNEIAENGRRVLLPVRSSNGVALGVGDYVSLSYSIQTRLREALGVDARGDGRLVLAIDEDGVGSFARLHDGEPLTAGEALLRYRIRWGRAETVRVAAEEWFVEEGQAEAVQQVRYAELALTPDGRSLLVGLRRADFSTIGDER